MLASFVALYRPLIYLSPKAFFLLLSVLGGCVLRLSLLLFHAQSHSLLQIRAQLPVSLNWSAGWTGTVPVWVLQVIRLTCLARATNLPSSAVLYEQIYSNAQLPDQPAL